MIETQKVLITGGSAGIGLATARLLLKNGSMVVIAGRSRERGVKALELLDHDNAAFVAGDAADPMQCDAIIDEATGKMGGVDALISCAGGNPRPRLLKDIAPEDLIPTINNAMAPTILPARTVLPMMIEQDHGVIVCLASDAGKISTPGEVAIGAAMAGIMMFCRAMANEVKRNHIRVNCITPSIVEGTDLHDALMADTFAGSMFAKAKTRAELGVVQSHDIAELASFLIGAGSKRITGQCVSITGGISTI